MSVLFEAAALTTHITNIIIGITAITSIFLSLYTLKENQKRSIKARAPSVAMDVKEVEVRVRKKGKETYKNILSLFYTGRRATPPFDEATIEKDDVEDDVIAVILISCSNIGRGPALNIKPPNVEGALFDHDDGLADSYPAYLGVDSQPLEFKFILAHSFDEWHKILSSGEIPVNVSLQYTDSQGELECKSTLSLSVQPFLAVDSKLVKVPWGVSVSSLRIIHNIKKSG